MEPGATAKEGTGRIRLETSTAAEEEEPEIEGKEEASTTEKNAPTEPYPPFASNKNDAGRAVSRKAPRHARLESSAAVTLPRYVRFNHQY
jgi:hypothetical protein